MKTWRNSHPTGTILEQWQFWGLKNSLIYFKYSVCIYVFIFSIKWGSYFECSQGVEMKALGTRCVQTGAVPLWSVVRWYLA